MLEFETQGLGGLEKWQVDFQNQSPRASATEQAKDSHTSQQFRIIFAKRDGVFWSEVILGSEKRRSWFQRCDLGGTTPGSFTHSPFLRGLLFQEVLRTSS